MSNDTHFDQTYSYAGDQAETWRGDSRQQRISFSSPNQSLGAEKQRYEVFDIFDALKPQPPIDWYVEGILSAGSVNLLVGEGGSKKTWASLDLSLCIAIGRDWLGHKTKRTKVLFVDEESGDRWLKTRIARVARGHGIDYEVPFRAVSLAQFNLGNLKDIDELKSLIIRENAKVVIIDALADIMPGCDENSVKDVQPIFLALRTIAEQTQSAILIIHHNNKGGGYRGSTAIKGAVDLMLTIESKPESHIIKFDTEKTRNTEPFSFVASASFGKDTFSLAPSTAPSTSKRLGNAQEYVMLFLTQNGPSQMEVIQDHADSCTPQGARQAVFQLAKAGQGYIQRVDAGGRLEKATYDLTDKGRAFIRENYDPFNLG